MGVEQSTMKQWIIHPEKDNPTHYHDGVMKRVPYPGVDVVEFEARPVKVDAVLESSDRDGEWRQRAVFKDRLFVNSINML